MKKIAYFLFFLSIVLLGFSVFSYVYLNKPLDTTTYPAYVEVTRDVGAFNLTKEDLNFGKVPAGSSTSRFLTFSNNYDFDVVLEISSSGNISDMIYYKSLIHVPAGQTERILITLTAEQERALGIYQGNIKFAVKYN